jgi:cell division protein FtsW (lipid II flippase)
MMDHNNVTQGKGRDTLLSFSLVALLGGAVIFFLNLVSLGIFIYVIVAIVGIAAVGFLHYVVWGYALSQQTAGEREEQRIKDLLEQESDDDSASWQRR